MKTEPNGIDSCLKCGRSTSDLDTDGMCKNCAECKCITCQSATKVIECIPVLDENEKPALMCYDCFSDRDTQQEFDWLEDRRQWKLDRKRIK